MFKKNKARYHYQGYICGVADILARLKLDVVLFVGVYCVR
jgi:hypothetical protein